MSLAQPVMFITCTTGGKVVGHGVRFSSSSGGACVCDNLHGSSFCCSGHF